MRKTALGLVAYLFMLLASQAASAENKICPYPDIYIEFDRAYHECANGHVKKGASCELFLDMIIQLFPRYDCQRYFDTKPVPAIWLFGAAYEDYFKLLHELALGTDGKFGGRWFSKEQVRAKKIFLSLEFKKVLDGHIAEEYYPLIKKLSEKVP